MKAQSLELIERHGIHYRRAIDATFLHNGTYLICDTALWNVDMRVIHADGHVQVIQDETKLTSDKLVYFIDDNLAQFRGTLVQLQNKKKNILRTRTLDYNTKDSLAVFDNGGAMRDEEGQIIESWKGTYDSRRKEFLFQNNVNMFTDSVFVKTESLTYESEVNRAIFNTRIDFWKEGNMLSANRGWYLRPEETFFFTDDVHGFSEEQEAWCDSLYYYRVPNDIRMYGRAQIQDTTRHVAAVAESVYYQDSLSKMTLCRQAAVALQTEEKGRVDTVYFGADTLIYQAIQRCDIPSNIVKAAEGRLSDIHVDPVTEYRKKAAQEAAQAKEAALAESGRSRPGTQSRGQQGGKKPSGTSGPGTEPPASPESPAAALPDTLSQAAKDLLTPKDSLTAGRDSLAPPLDSLQMRRDSLARRDTTKIGFATAIHHVKIFRTDMQARCDSMTYCDLDSIARFYLDPVIWNEEKRQYTADSVFVLIKDNGMDRASLQSNAFITTKENELYYDQIKGAEVMAYFDSTSALRRFDALGGANAIFFLKEKNDYATANQVECKMMSAEFEDGDLRRNSYFGPSHNNAVPLAQLSAQDKQMKGFKWRDEERPKGRWDVTSLAIRPSERSAYMRRPRARFQQTDIYFPGYMDGVYRELAIRDSLARLPKPKKRQAPDMTAPSDSLPAASDSLRAISDKVDSLSVGRDSLSVVSELPAPADSLKAAADSLGADFSPAAADSLSTPADSLTEKERAALLAAELRAQKRAEQHAKREAEQARREEYRKLKLAERDARWARLDSLDAARQEAKAQKALARKRAATLRLVRLRERQKARDEARLQQYIEQYRKKKERDERRKTHVPARERASDLESWGDISSPAPSGDLSPGSDAILGDPGIIDDRSVLGGSRLPRPESRPGL